MTSEMTDVLVVGASGSIGQLAVAESIRAGYVTTALVRNPGQASLFPERTRIAVGDLKDPGSLHDATVGVTGIVFTHGTYGGPEEAEAVNYGAVRNVLYALRTPARIALMTTIGVTKPTPGHDWKRRGERLVRARCCGPGEASTGFGTVTPCRCGANLTRWSRPSSTCMGTSTRPANQAL